MHDERVIELLARSLDEPLSIAEQAEVERALANSIALRLAAEGLREFDALLKRTGMAIPAEGFPARVLARIESYERRRTRIEWFVTLLLLFLAGLAAVGWAAVNYRFILDAVADSLTAVTLILPVWINSFFTLLESTSRAELVVYALLVFALTWIWARVSGPAPLSSHEPVPF